MSGSKPGERRGGRKKGTPNKRKAALLRFVGVVGKTPLEYLEAIRNMDAPAGSTPAEQIQMLMLKLDAAKAMLPYTSPRKGAEGDNPMDKADRAAAIRQAVGEMHKKSNPKEHR